LAKTYQQNSTGLKRIKNKAFGTSNMGRAVAVELSTGNQRSIRGLNRKYTLANSEPEITKLDAFH